MPINYNGTNGSAIESNQLLLVYNAQQNTAKSDIQFQTRLRYIDN